MKEILNGSTILPILTLIGASLAVDAAANTVQEKWDIVLGPLMQQDEAIQVALQDLTETGGDLGLLFEVRDEYKGTTENVILLGSPERNPAAARFLSQRNLAVDRIEDDQGYAIVTVEEDGKRTLLVCGGSIVGDVYGLYWIWDRLRVYRRIPTLNTRRSPALGIRMGAAWGRSGYGGQTKEQMRRALRYGANWVAGPAVLDLVPWNSESENTINEQNREKARKLIAYAHSLHMKYFSFANEFTFHPSLLEEFGASLSPCDPKLWDAVQAKFRMLFQALPELDGIELCNDDISGFWEDYRAFDLMHEGEDCEWPYDKRFRTFVRKVWDVVVGEFQKTYFHFTWSLVTYEQHSQPDVFRKIFTDEIPLRGLYLIPKITAGDRWWHQPYNPTFNLTPHNTLVCFETMNYYESGRSHLFPTFAGQYYQAGLQTILQPIGSNVKGMATLVGGERNGWETSDAAVYALYRLAWNPDEPIKDIARDFCAIHFGEAAEAGMAEILLLSPAAYKYGLHIEPVSYGQFNSLLQVRVGTFPAEGYPRIDGGKEHLDFLREIYLRCKPWKTETLDDLDHGLATAGEMIERFGSVKPILEDPEEAREIEDRLHMTRLLIETNNLYVRAAFAYFEYLEGPSPERRSELAEVCARLNQVRADFIDAPGFYYQLFGVDQLLRNAQSALDDLKSAKEALERAPTRTEIESTIKNQQALYRQVLEDHGDEAVKFLHTEIQIDGRDILKIRGDRYEIEHLRWDAPHVRECTFLQPLPQQPVTVVPRDIQSRPMHPFILEQPSEDNDWTASVYLYDEPGGKEWMNFDLYFIRKRPEELGLEIPWKE